MITLNLVPAEMQKQHIKQHVHYAVRNNLLLIFIIVSIISMMTLFGRIYLENQFIESVADTTRTTGRLQSPVTQDVQLSNNSLRVAQQIQEEFIPWQNLLFTLSRITPDQVVINQLQITHEQDELRILGNAKNRDAFLTFKTNLENDPLFVEVLSPVSNLLSKTDINFTLNTMINEDLIE